MGSASLLGHAASAGPIVHVHSSAPRMVFAQGSAFLGGAWLPLSPRDNFAGSFSRTKGILGAKRSYLRRARRRCRGRPATAPAGRGAARRAGRAAAVSLNSDLGEALGRRSLGNDDGLLPLIDTANVACGFHAGDPGAMRETVAKAVAAGVTVGAHPGLPDLVGFGRREMKLDPDEVRDLVRCQVGALQAFLDAGRAPLDHIKPHGPLSGMVAPI